MANSQGPVLLSGEKTVALAGTAEPLVGASQRVKSVVIIAKSGNTNRIYLGGSDGPLPPMTDWGPESPST
jgi:hypothetical protein